MVILGAIGDFVSFGLAPQTLVAPAGSFTLVANVFFAYFFLGQTLLWQDYAGTVLVICGAVVAVVFGSHEETSFTIQELIELWDRVEMIVYAIVVLMLLAFLYLFISRAEVILANALMTALEDHAKDAATFAQSSHGLERGSGQNPVQPGAHHWNADTESKDAQIEEDHVYMGELAGKRETGSLGSGSVVSDKSGKVRGKSQSNGYQQPAASANAESAELASFQDMHSKSDEGGHDAGASRPASPTGNGSGSESGPRSVATHSRSSGSNSDNDNDSDGDSDTFNIHGDSSKEGIIPRNASQLSQVSHGSGASDAAVQLDRMRKANATDVVVEALESPPEEYMYYARMHPVCYGIMSGTIGGQSVLFAKAVSELLKVTFSGDNQFRFLLTYVQIVALVTCMLLQQHFLAKGLQLFDTLLIVPVFSSTFMFSSIIAGGVYYREFDAFTTTSWACFPIGIALVLVGVYILSGRQKQAQAEHEKRMGELEATSSSDHTIKDRGSSDKPANILSERSGDEEMHGPDHGYHTSGQGNESTSKKPSDGDPVDDWHTASAVAFSPSPRASPAASMEDADDLSGMRRLTADTEGSPMRSKRVHEHAQSAGTSPPRSQYPPPQPGSVDADADANANANTNAIAVEGKRSAVATSYQDEKDNRELEGVMMRDLEADLQWGNELGTRSARLSRPRGHTVGHTVSGGLSFERGAAGAARRAGGTSAGLDSGGGGDPRRGSLLKAGWSHQFGMDYGMGSVVGIVPGIGSYFGGVDLGRHSDALDALRARRLRRAVEGRRLSLERGQIQSGVAASGQFQPGKVVPISVAGIAGSGDRRGLSRVVSAPTDGADAVNLRGASADALHVGAGVAGGVASGSVTPVGAGAGANRLGDIRRGHSGGIHTPGTRSSGGILPVPVPVLDWGNAGGRRATVMGGELRPHRYRSGSVLDTLVGVYNSLNVAANASSAVMDSPFEMHAGVAEEPRSTGRNGEALGEPQA